MNNSVLSNFFMEIHLTSMKPWLCSCNTFFFFVPALMLPKRCHSSMNPKCSKLTLFMFLLVALWEGYELQVANYFYTRTFINKQTFFVETSMFYFVSGNGR